RDSQSPRVRPRTRIGLGPALRPISRRLWLAAKSAPSPRRSPSAPARPAMPSRPEGRAWRYAGPRSRFCTCSMGPYAFASRTATLLSRRSRPCRPRRRPRTTRPSTPASTPSSPETRRARPEAPARAWITTWLATAQWKARFAKPLSTPMQTPHRSQKGDISTWPEKGTIQLCLDTRSRGVASGRLLNYRSLGASGVSDENERPNRDWRRDWIVGARRGRLEVIRRLHRRAPAWRLDHLAGRLLETLRQERRRARLSAAGRQVRPGRDHRTAADSPAGQHLPGSTRYARESSPQAQRPLQRFRQLHDPKRADQGQPGRRNHLQSDRRPRARHHLDQVRDVSGRSNS